MTDLIKACGYLPGAARTPGRLVEVTLEVSSLGSNELVLPELTVRDEHRLTLFDPDRAEDLRADPAGGGGPGRDEDEVREARLFGLVNVAYHGQRMLRRVAELLGHPLPHLLIRIGNHASPRRWGGGHYRLAAQSYDPPEPGPVASTGEIHLGVGGGFVPTAPEGHPYFAAPAHNLAIIYHEIGHHVCRHTADFRLNGLRPLSAQTNKKIPLDEGTCDLLTASLLNSPDIYGWHRASLPMWDRRRRALGPQWTMAGFQGGATDPHADGTIWASACWSAREQVVAAGYSSDRFDRMLLRGLELSLAASQAVREGPSTSKATQAEPTSVALKQRRHVSRLLEAMLIADPDLSDPVLAGMAAHGIRPNASNVELRRAATPCRGKV